ncbi:hypothetical protein CROQUDRAFT_90650 [Cronartium quercuum f. sp. fusiforme G11]|uniref:Uncharacterized protein n=1 Tax=Cronartium quercuum f. sp. fusiforme G11 TaxID=708437 RepID=A0A9P6NJD5_9BASI|nr:hypothetical protein CROQUDRAFT_90650 [Cronartium quercuum f. sp. fusiforme G11]
MTTSNRYKKSSIIKSCYYCQSINRLTINLILTSSLITTLAVPYHTKTTDKTNKQQKDEELEDFNHSIEHHTFPTNSKLSESLKLEESSFLKPIDQTILTHSQQLHSFTQSQPEVEDPSHISTTSIHHSTPIHPSRPIEQQNHQVTPNPSTNLEPQPSHEHPTSFSSSSSSSESPALPVKSPIPTYYENLNGVWVRSDNWNLYGLSGPTQRHQTRSLSLNESEDQANTNSQLKYHSSTRSTNELAPSTTNNNSLNTNSPSPSSSNSPSSKLYLPAGWNHTSPRGPLYVVPAIVIASLFIAISVVGTVVCLVGRRRAAKRRIIRLEGVVANGGANDKIIKEKRIDKKIRTLTIIKIGDSLSNRKKCKTKIKEKEAAEAEVESIVVIDECRRAGKRSFFSGIRNRNHRRRGKVKGEMKGSNNDSQEVIDEIDDKQSASKEELSPMVPVLPEHPMNEVVVEPQDGPPGPQLTPPLPSVNRSESEQHSSDFSPRLTTHFSLQPQPVPLTAEALASQSLPLNRPRTNPLAPVSIPLLPRHRASSSAVIPSSLNAPLEVHRSYSMAELNLSFLNSNEPPLPPSILPPAYSGRQSSSNNRSNEKRPARDNEIDWSNNHNHSSIREGNQEESRIIGHIATDDKSLLENISALGSCPNLTTSTTSTIIEGPSAPPLVLDSDGFEELVMNEQDDEPQGNNHENNENLLPIPSQPILTSFELPTSLNNSSTSSSSFIPIPTEVEVERSEKEKNELLWKLISVPSRPSLIASSPHNQGVEEEEEEEDQVAIVPVAPPYEENA